MKKILLLLALGITFASCHNKDLDKPGVGQGNVCIAIEWKAEQTVPVQHGMRINLFSLDENPSYGLNDVKYDGCNLFLPYGSKHRSFAYSYTGNNIYFRNELNSTLIEAYCSPQVRGTYSRSFPNETTVREPEGSFYVGENEEYVIEKNKENIITIEPENVLYTYTFDVLGIEGTEFISDTRGAISGMSSSYFISTGGFSALPATVLFNARADVPNNKITGSFRTFGRLPADNLFTIEILFPSNETGIYQFSWDVTNQIENGTNFHIVIADSGIVIPDEGGEVSDGWNVIVEKWEDETVKLD